MPYLAVVDETYNMSAPKTVAVSTGLDALTHAVEAYISKKAMDLTDTLAISAVKRILTYLPKKPAGTGMTKRQAVRWRWQRWKRESASIIPA